MNNIIRLFLFVLLSNSCFGQSEYAKAAFNLDINFLFQNKPASESDYHLRSVVMYTHLFFVHHDSLFDAYSPHVIKEHERLSDKGQKGRLALEKACWAFINLKYGNSFQAIWNLRQANNLAHESAEPDAYALLADGLINVAVASVPDSKKWVFSLLGMDSDFEEGMAKIKRASHSDNTMVTFEAIYIYEAIQVYLLKIKNTDFIEGHLKGASNLEKLILEFFSLKYRNSAYFINNDHLFAQTERSSLGYFDSYIRAKHFLYSAQYERAYQSSLQFIGRHIGSNYIRDAHFVGYISQELQGTNAGPMLDSIRYVNSKTTTMDDKYALQVALGEESINLPLMQVRLALDGGYIQKAQLHWQNISERDLANHRDSIEYAYRGARIYSLVEKELAKKWYYKVVDAQYEKNLYYAPKSYLELAMYAFIENQEERALEYLTELEKFDKYTYQSAIESEASTLLNTIHYENE